MEEGDVHILLLRHCPGVKCYWMDGSDHGAKQSGNPLEIGPRSFGWFHINGHPCWSSWEDSSHSPEPVHRRMPGE